MRIRYNKYCQSWTEIDEFKGWLTKSSNNKNEHEYAFCKLCHCDITAHKNSITRHSVSEKHIFNKRKISQNKKVTDMAFIAAEDNVKRAEIKLCAFVASNNLPFRMMDTLSPLCANLFPDSKIASKLAVRRTKATSILKNCLGEVFQNKLINTLRIPGTFFSIIMDETTDCATKKQCAFTVIYFCTEKNKVITTFFDMKEANGATAIDLYNCLKNVILEKRIPLTNLVGYSSDTTNVMFGDNQSVYVLLKADLPYIICVKCSCHLIHLAASKACLTLPRSIEDMLRNVGSHFSRSSARQGKLREIQEFFKIEIHKILLPANTRWLSLKHCVDRVLEQYDALIAYFHVESLSDHSRTTEEITNVITNPISKLYLEFMSYTLGLLIEFNKLFQSEAPLLYRLKPETESLLKIIYSNFLKRECLGQNVFDLNHKNPHLFCKLEHIYLGVGASQTLMESKSTLPEEDVTYFLKNCLNFYIELASQIKNRFVFTDNVFDIIEIVNPLKAQSFNRKSLIDIINKFPFIKEFINCQELDNEWRHHGTMDYIQLQMDPSKSVEEYWHYVLNFKNAAGRPLFPNLKIVIQFLLILPFSNASVERIFSDLNNIKSDKRNKLNTSTVNALLHTKAGIKADGLLDFEPTGEMLNINIRPG